MTEIILGTNPFSTWLTRHKGSHVEILEVLLAIDVVIIGARYLLMALHVHTSLKDKRISTQYHLFFLGKKLHLWPGRARK